MNITIVGGGNIGTQFAVHCAETGNKVKVFTSKSELFQKELKIVNENNEIIQRGEVELATNDPKVAFENANIIFITYPAYLMKEISETILPYVKPNLKICLIPGTGGGECAFKECINKGAILFGLQRVPSVARLEEYGSTVKATGYRDELFVASLPHNEVNECAKIISNILKMKCTPMPNYLNLTLTPSNPILHTTRLKTIFKDYDKVKTYDSLPLFYEEWNDETSELLFKCDDEVQKICKSLKQFDLSYVKSLKIHYESDTPEKLTKKIRSIKGFKGLTTPSIKTDKGYIPDLHSRYFTADFPYGLSILVQIAKMLNISVPNMQETLNWYNNIKIVDGEYYFKEYGINNLDDFIIFYSK